MKKIRPIHWLRTLADWFNLSSSPMDTKKIILPIVWVMALVGALILSTSLTDQSLHFFGIAGKPEQVINFQYPVEIVQSYVVEGKQVEQGDLLLEVKRRELDAELNNIDQEIRRYTLQKQETINTTNSQLASLTAKKQAIIADMDYQIHRLQQRLKINTNILKNISGKYKQPNRTELNDLIRKRRFSVEAIQAEIDHLTAQLNSSNRPIDAQLKALQHRKDEMQRQTIALKVRAQFNGRIGSVNFKTGELVSPFQAIMSVHSATPRYVKGYIHENIVNDVKVGQAVWVKSIAFSEDAKQLSGTVESLGNRIIEYPERLKKNPLVPAWGREVNVRLKNDNHLLFGEKVQVLLSTPEQTSLALNLINDTEAAVLESNPDQLYLKIKSDDPDIKSKKIEASGLVWIENEHHYLLISDEKYKHKTGLFIMNEQGMIEKRLTLQNKDAIVDLESISTDDGYIYLLSSLSHNEDDELKKKRKRLIRFKYQNQKVKQQQKLNLYKVLKTIRDNQPHTRLAAFLHQAIADHSMDIEAHFVSNNDLYIGFKAPLENAENTMIVKISNVNAMFEGIIPQAEIWYSPQLLDPETGEPMQLSDMTMVDDQLYLLSVSRSDVKNSVLWKYQTRHDALKNIQGFPGLKAEGISYRREQSLLTAVFDRGKKKHSKLLSIPVSTDDNQ
jgi:multidrug resistance efflux pump